MNYLKRCFLACQAVRKLWSTGTWNSVELPLPPRLLGKGSIREFKTYFDGESRVQVVTVEDVCKWLLRCEYVRDAELFFQDDYWQHPVTFEKLRKGDCEDHALWAWRKLNEIGTEALFVCGEWDRGAHAWVIFKKGNVEYLFETTAKKSDAMIRPRVLTDGHYSPHLAVDRHCRTYVYRGWLKRFTDEMPVGALISRTKMNSNL